MADLCISYDRVVRPRQHPICCDVCERWQHRTCGSGITLQQYRDAIKNRTDIDFFCTGCTRREPEPMDIDLLGPYDRDEIPDQPNQPE